MEVDFQNWNDYRAKHGVRQTSSCDLCGRELGGFDSSEEPAWTAYEEGDELKISCHECTQKYFQELQELKEKEAKEKEAEEKRPKKKMRMRWIAKKK